MPSVNNGTVQRTDVCAPGAGVASGVTPLPGSMLCRGRSSRSPTIERSGSWQAALARRLPSESPGAASNGFVFVCVHKDPHALPPGDALLPFAAVFWGGPGDLSVERTEPWFTLPEGGYRPYQVPIEGHPRGPRLSDESGSSGVSVVPNSSCLVSTPYSCMRASPDIKIFYSCMSPILVFIHVSKQWRCHACKESCS